MSGDETGTRAVAIHGVISPFSGDQEEWVEYAERLDHYFIANDIVDEAKKRAILLNGVGPSTYRLIKTLSLPKTPKDFKFDEIVEKVRTHFNPKPSAVIKRFEFNTRRQKEGESESEFVAALRKIAEHCKYGDMLNELLCDRLVCGIYDKHVQQRFLREKELTYDNAFATALAAEQAKKDSKRLQQDARTEDKPPLQLMQMEKPVNHVAKSTPNPSNKRSPPSGRTTDECYRCGRKHQASRCRFRDYECHFCKKKGHIAAACRKKKQLHDNPKHEQTNRVTDGGSSDEDNEQEEYSLYRVSSGSSKPLHVHLTMNGVPM